MATWKSVVVPMAPVPETKPNVYHQHLDVCEWCNNHPFDLCPEGYAKLQQAVKDIKL
jgi:hypothetical protein